MMTQLTEKEFNELLQEETVRAVASRLSKGFAQWDIRRRHRRNITASLLVVCTVATSLWFGIDSSQRSYDSVASNRSGYSDDFWLEIANDMLTTQV